MPWPVKTVKQGVRLTLDEWLSRFPERAGMPLLDALSVTVRGVFFEAVGSDGESLPGDVVEVLDGRDAADTEIQVFAHRKVTPEWARKVAAGMLEKHEEPDEEHTPQERLQWALGHYIDAWEDGEGGFGNFDGSNLDDDNGSSIDELRSLFGWDKPTVEALAELVIRWVERSKVFACDATGEIITVTTADFDRIWPGCKGQDRLWPCVYCRRVDPGCTLAGCPGPEATCGNCADCRRTR